MDRFNFLGIKNKKGKFVKYSDAKEALDLSEVSYDILKDEMDFYRRTYTENYKKYDHLIDRVIVLFLMEVFTLVIFAKLTYGVLWVI